MFVPSRSLFSVVAALFVGLFMVASTLQAATFHVSTRADFSDRDLKDGVCVDKRGTCSLRAAVEQANALSGHDRIELEPAGYALALGESGDLKIEDDLTIVGKSDTTTSIDAAELSPRNRIFEVLGSATLRLKGLKLINGEHSYTGGVIRHRSSGSLVLNQITIENGRALQGGAITIEMGRVDIQDSKFIGNEGCGGAIMAYGGAEISISESFFEGNSSSTCRGGAILAAGVKLSITDSEFRSNSAEGGGAIRSDSVDLAISNSLFVNNTALDSGGGAISNLDGEMTLYDSEFREQESGGDGGAIVNWGKLLMKRCLIVENSAKAGGGLYQNDGEAHILNSTFSGNSASGGGGGLRAQRGKIYLYSSTITENVALVGGGLYRTLLDETRIEATNTIVAGNFASGDAPDCGTNSSSQPAVVSGGNNLIGNAWECYFDAKASDLVGDSSGKGVLDAMLSPLNDHGGETMVHALLKGSPAIDKGKMMGCFNHLGEKIRFDQRGPGYKRHQGPKLRCDIGAFEF